MISVKQALQNIAGQMSVTNTFKYGSMDEMDQLGDEVTVWPAIFLFRFMSTKLDYGRSLGVNNKPNINILFIDKTDFGEFTEQSDAIRDLQVSYCQEFMNRMANYRTPDGNKYFNIKENDYGNLTYVYDEFDVNVTGVRLEMNVATMYKDNACLT